MADYKDSYAALFEQLRTAGYPDQALVLEMSLGMKHRVDLAIVDPRTTKPVALFELRPRKDEASVFSAYKQLEEFRAKLGIHVPLYAVFQTPKGLEINRVHPPKPGEARTKPVEDLLQVVEALPPYGSLQATGRQKAVDKNRRTRDWYLIAFMIACWIGVLLVAFILWVDFMNWYRLSTERLALIGAMVALIIIPFAGKLKVLGVEFERLTHGGGGGGGAPDAGGAVGGVVDQVGGIVDKAGGAVDGAVGRVTGAVDAAAGKAGKGKKVVAAAKKKAGGLIPG